MKGFILSRHWRDTSKGVSLELWLSTDRGPCQVTIPAQKPLFFIRQSDVSIVAPLLRSYPVVAIKPLELNNVYGEPVAGVYCAQQRQVKTLFELFKQHGVASWEHDIRPVERFLMERFITSGVELDDHYFSDELDHDSKNLTLKNDSSSDSFLNHSSSKNAPLNSALSNNGLPNKPITFINTQTLKPAEYTPVLSVASIDIETSMDATALYSIAVYTASVSLVFMVSDKSSKTTNIDGLRIEWCADAKACLVQFFAWLEQYDPDILMGWHVVQFDCWVLSKLCERLNVPFTLGRNQQIPHWRVDEKNSGESHPDDDVPAADIILDKKRRYLQVPGRVVLDGIELLKTAFYQFDSFSLQNVANELLDDSKLLSHDDRGQAISDLFLSPLLDDKIALAKYNLHDCKLVWDIFEKTKLLDFAMARSRLTGMPLDKMGGSVASFEYVYLPQLHRKGYVAPNLGELESDVVSPGGYVMRSLPGLYRHVLVLDFKSLYPSIIRTFAIDPYAFWFADHNDLSPQEIIDGYNGAFFAREHHLLPTIIKELWDERDKAKANNDQPLSQAIKIIMNSFYGILGSQGCRFYDPRVCSSITLRGHDIIQKSHEWIEQQGYSVIYGDTDSLFVWLGEDFDDNCDVSVDSSADSSCEQKNHSNDQAQAIGCDLAAGLNIWWNDYLQAQYDLPSVLEIEFETHYQDFLMPTIRGSEKGSKKRYAGVINTKHGKQVIFKGLEAVRNDWTNLAKEFQQTLYALVFDKQSYQTYIQQFVAQVLLGEKDHQLIYRKRLRRALIHYEKSNPPHVKAARKLERHMMMESKGRMSKGDTIEYRITLNGPEPIAYQPSGIDYQHYIDKQLKPIADSILCFLGDSFDNVIKKQMRLF